MSVFYKVKTIYSSLTEYIFSKAGFTNKTILWGVKLDLKTNLSDGTKVYKRCDIRSSDVGYGTYIGWDSVLRDTKIGKYCSIGPKVEVIYGRHPVNSFVSTHPAFFSTKKQSGFTFVDKNMYQENKVVEGKSLVIGNDVWLGSNVVILEGVSIGNGAIVGANSTVTKDLEPYGIYVGSPAKKIGYRYSKEEIEKLQNVQWWDMPASEIKNRSDLFTDIDAFVNSFEK